MWTWPRVRLTRASPGHTQQVQRGSVPGFFTLKLNLICDLQSALHDIFTLQALWWAASSSWASWGRARRRSPSSQLPTTSPMLWSSGNNQLVVSPKSYSWTKNYLNIGKITCLSVPKKVTFSCQSIFKPSYIIYLSIRRVQRKSQHWIEPASGRHPTNWWIGRRYFKERWKTIILNKNDKQEADK